MTFIEKTIKNKELRKAYIDTVRDDWVYCDNLIESCKKLTELFEYTCKQTFRTVKTHFDNAEGEPKKLGDEMKRTAYILEGFNEKNIQLMLVCKYSLRKEKDYVYAKNIAAFLNKASKIAFDLLYYANFISYHAKNLQKTMYNDLMYCTDEWCYSVVGVREYYQQMNHGLCIIKSKLKNELNDNIIFKSDIEDKSTEAA